MDEDEDGVCSTHVVSWLWLLLCVYVMSMMKRLEQANSIVVVFDAHGFGICNMALDVTVG